MLTKSNQGSVDSLYAEYISEILGRSVEYGSSWFFSYSVNGYTLNIYDLFVRESVRNSLVKGRIWRRVMDIFVSSGCHEINVYVATANKRAAKIVALYSGLGFCIVGTDQYGIIMNFSYR